MKTTLIAVACLMMGGCQSPSTRYMNGLIFWGGSTAIGIGYGEYTGSRTVVGEQTALPEISDASDSLAVRVYESVKGAKVWTAKDCRVTINYSNAYTNTYFGIVETQDAMRLDVTIEPLDISTAQPK